MNRGIRKGLEMLGSVDTLLFGPPDQHSWANMLLQMKWDEKQGESITIRRMKTMTKQESDLERKKGSNYQIKWKTKKKAYSLKT